jgi:hypothetical protein
MKLKTNKILIKEPRKKNQKNNDRIEKIITYYLKTKLKTYKTFIKGPSMKISNKITRTEIKKSKEKMIRVYFLWNREKKGKKNKR